MELEQIEERLRHWKRRHAELEMAFGDFNALTGALPDCKLMAPIFDVWTAYTVAVSELVGDKAEWLQWYQYECKMGKRPMVVMFENGKELNVRTLRHLARVIADVPND